jgi:cobalt/nickel transport system permease protein
MKRRTLLLVGLFVALVLAGGVSYYASASPDGLNKVSEEKGFSDRATEHGLADSPVADYSTRGVGDARLSGGIAGVLGVLATFAVGGVVFAVVRRRSPAAADSTELPARR